MITTAHASTRNGDITEVPMRTNVAGVIAIGTSDDTSCHQLEQRVGHALLFF